MKRIVLSIAGILLLSLFVGKAEEKKLNREQLALRTEITKFLKEEGFSPTIDSDGDIKFDADGKTYYVAVSAVDDNPLYLSFFRNFRYPDEYSQDVVFMATKSLNKYKGVKVTCYDYSFQVSAELYLRNAELFKNSFYKLMKQIDSAQGDVLSECANVGAYATGADVPFVVTNLEIANTEEDGRIIQDYGATLYDYKTKFLQPRVTLVPNKSSGNYVVHVKLYKGNELQRGPSSPEDCTFMRTVTLQGGMSQVEVLGNWGSKRAGKLRKGNYRFEVWCEDSCIGSKSFRIQ